MQQLNRRRLLTSAITLAAASMVPRVARGAPSPNSRFVGYPFTLGVASGYPTPDGVTLWTRLAPIPLIAGGGMGQETAIVRYEVAEDEGFGKVVARGSRQAIVESAFSVHADVRGLSPGRWYFYRFLCGDEVSPVGRTRTAEAPGAPTAALRFAIASCQHFEHGYYAAHRHMAAEQPDLVLFLGDYIYEMSWGSDLLRSYVDYEAHDLEQYRVRYAQHRCDEDLQRLHGQVPVAVCWDDHEVDNDWAGELSERLEPNFVARRAAAFQAFYEHMPMPERMRPQAGGLRLYESFAYGDLARFVVLDDRQYRSAQACPDPAKGGGSTVLDPGECAALAAADRAMLGAPQESWLDATLAASKQRWNLLAQQTLVAPGWMQQDGQRRVWTDGWDGYPKARQRLIDILRRRKGLNPVILGGDIHSTVVADLHEDPEDPRTPVVASEFCGTSITSQGSLFEDDAALRALHPHIRYANGKARGYLVFELSHQGLRSRLRTVDERKHDSPVNTAVELSVEAGRPGIA